MFISEVSVGIASNILLRPVKTEQNFKKGKKSKISKIARILTYQILLVWQSVN